MRNVSGNSGRMGRSMSAANEDFALARAAFALDEAAGNASAGVGVFAISTVSGKKSMPSRGLRIGARGSENYVVTYADNDGAVCLFRQFSRFEWKWICRLPTGQWSLAS